MTSLLTALRRAETAAAAGARPEAILILQRAAAIATVPGSSDQARLHADLCRRLAHFLTEEDRLPEAMQALQEAVDHYGRVPGAEADAAECAREIVAGVRRMWGRPDRLYLLIARLDREQRQLAVRPRTESAQAELLFKTATILHRRDRFDDALERYRRALILYQTSEDAGEAQALCHHRMAGLCQYELGLPDEAESHYREAIRLYARWEAEWEGEQMNRSLCEELLRNLLSRRLGDANRDD